MLEFIKVLNNFDALVWGAVLLCIVIGALSDD